jgi:hypothetical protein
MPFSELFSASLGKRSSPSSYYANHRCYSRIYKDRVSCGYGHPQRSSSGTGSDWTENFVKNADEKGIDRLSVSLDVSFYELKTVCTREGRVDMLKYHLYVP